MDNLSIINSAIIVVYFTYKFINLIRNYITITIDKTFWEKKPYGIYFTKWDYHINGWKACRGNSGKVIFRFQWRDPENLSDEMSKRRD